eukprot:TRINITY_DN3335_c0_g2_i1.p1 TRINITY_DN3335_c0_g2~~TRINITY_DN3335_c0_g2_i1.p1  ORF type:complete len:738 (+),score=207.06 TRINITY_DN3335_c0_g2_i1:307-2520(+)
MTPQAVCSHCFKDGDLVWNCKNCQADETCVLCNACFRESDHTGHEVLFFYSNTEGCCDCGDPSAWDPAGFCSRHGRKENHNPLDDLPPTLATSCRLVVHSVVQLILSHMLIDHHAPTAYPEESEEDTWHIRIVQRNESVGHLISALLSIQRDQYEVTRIVRSLEQHGSAVVAEQLCSHAARDAILALRGHPCKAEVHCVTTSHAAVHGAMLLPLTEWLLRACRAADGLAQLVIEGLTTGEPSLLTLLLSQQKLLPPPVVAQVNSLLLQLLVDTSFKVHFGKVYAQHYTQLALENQNPIFNFSVQFLNRDCHVRLLVLNHGLLHSIVSALVLMLSPTIAQGNKLPLPVNEQHYVPIIKDLRYCFCHSPFSLEILQDPGLAGQLTLLLGVLANVQGMDPQKRLTGNHVEWESSDWMGAFNLSLTLASSFEKVVTSVLSTIAQLGTDSEVDAAMGLMVNVLFYPVIQLLQHWGESQPALTDPPGAGIGSTFSVSDDPVTFHNPIQRYVVAVLRSVYVMQFDPRKASTFSRWLEKLMAEIDLGCGLVLMEAPLRTMVFAAQIQAGMWVRNGTMMQDQVLNYMRWPLCSHFLDKDLLAVQLAAARVPPTQLLGILLERFELGAWGSFQEQGADLSSDNQSMVAEMLTLIIRMVTELPLSPTALQQGMKLQREVVHLLAWKEATHSELTALCDQELMSGTDEATLDEVLLRVATVSYTHLRAHETPEHLVCRLLLEKKKKKRI